MSIDFSIPPGLKSIDGKAPRNRAPRYYVPLSPGIQALRTDETFVGLAQVLCHNTILWLRTEGEEEDREVVKFAYDVPWDGSLRRVELASFGLAPVLFEFETLTSAAAVATT